jgi:membrane associated rhomboid family serine protease
MYGVSLLATIRTTGFQAPAGGGFSALMSLGAISGKVLQEFGASLPLPYNLSQPWRLVMAVFLHGSLLHIAFNMWVLMDFGPQVEEMYGSARYLFIYVATGVGGYVLSSLFFHFAIGGSGAILGLCGVIIAVTAGSRSIGHQMLRAQVVRLLIYIVVIAILPIGLFGNIDNLAHLGGFLSGFALGKIMVDRAPSSPEEWKRANLLGWATALVIAASLGMAAFGVLRAG